MRQTMVLRVSCRVLPISGSGVQTMVLRVGTPRELHHQHWKTMVSAPKVVYLADMNATIAAEAHCGEKKGNLDTQRDRPCRVIA